MASSKAITDLSQAATLTGAEEAAIVQSGTTVKVPIYDATEANADIYSIVNPGNVLSAQLTIATADVLTLNGTPIDFITAPGAGKAIEIQSATIEVQFNSAAYTTNGIVELITDTATDSQFETPNTSYLFATVNTLRKFVITEPSAVTDTQIVENQEVHVQVRSGNPAAGDSDIIIRALYRIINV